MDLDLSGGTMTHPTNIYTQGGGLCGDDISGIGQLRTSCVEANLRCLYACNSGSAGGTLSRGPILVLRRPEISLRSRYGFGYEMRPRGRLAAQLLMMHVVSMLLSSLWRGDPLYMFAEENVARCELFGLTVQSLAMKVSIIEWCLISRVCCTDA